jgi:hypothetical protein
MMTDTLTGFTPEELELLAGAVNTIPHPAYKDLSTKIARMRLVDKKVRFLHKGEELTGELRGYKDWEGVLMAEIASKGFIYRVGAETELLGEA